jgi:UDP-N-acetylmuramoyl-tripeptide--D-alanyl-D-alanine ligase
MGSLRSSAHDHDLEHLAAESSAANRDNSSGRRMQLTLLEVCRALRGVLSHGVGEARVTSYHTDSREVVPGGLFCALQGAEADGHDFCRDAAGRGAAAVVVEHDVALPGDAAVVRVSDTWAALYDLARHVLAQVSPGVIGITGSNGKTSTREMVAAVLGARHRVLQTEGNLNTETGLPLTLLRLEPSHTLAVLEMGMQGPGEIARLAELARPTVGVVTMVGSVHLEYFEGPEALARAKGELVEALPAGGLAVLNADDRWYELLRSLSRAPVVGFGLEAGDLCGEGWRPRSEGGSEMTVDGRRVRVGPSGRHQALNALAALAVARHWGVPLAEAIEPLAGLIVPHRLQERPMPAGYTLVDDAYNASPESMQAAFDVIAEKRAHGSGRRLALLGEMRELGGTSEEAHIRVGRQAAALFDRVAVLDAGAGRLLAEAAGADLVSDHSAAVAWVRSQARPGDIVLVKGSHGVALDEVVQELTAPGTRDGEVPVSGVRRT